MRLVPDHPVQLTNPVWKFSKIKPRQAYHRINQSRRAVCPKSPFWHEDFDLDRHHTDLLAAATLRTTFRDQTLAREASWRKYWSSIGMSLPLPLFSSSSRRAFDGRDPDSYTTERSAVLHQHTVFASPVLRSRAGFPVAAWPCREEFAFEGSSRIVTVEMQGRFLPLPRDAHPPSVGWQSRAMVPASRLDAGMGDRGISEEEIFFKFWFVGLSEFTDERTEAVDEDGLHALGAGLLALLDPRDQY